MNSIATQAISRETVYTVDCIVGTNSREFVAGCEGSKYWQTYPGLTKREFARELRRRGWKWTAQGWICGSCLGRHEAAR